jgi:hypothetical protein
MLKDIVMDKGILFVQGKELPIGIQLSVIICDKRIIHRYLIMVTARISVS